MKLGKISIKTHEGKYAVYVGKEMKRSGFTERQAQVEANLMRRDLGRAVVDYTPGERSAAEKRRWAFNPEGTYPYSKSDKPTPKKDSDFVDTRPLGVRRRWSFSD